MILSILIPTIIGREKQFNELEDFLQWQVSLASLWDKVEIKSICDNKELSIGAKRNQLLELATGEYCVMIDDDDTVHFQFVERIVNSLQGNPDCLGYKELCLYDGKSAKTSDISLKYKQWQEGNGMNPMSTGFNHVRTPFYKVPIKTELCKQVGFKNLRYGEDAEFSKQITPLLRNEIYIDEFMYIYRYKHEPHNLKYGIKQ